MESEEFCMCESPIQHVGGSEIISTSKPARVRLFFITALHLKYGNLPNFHRLFLNKGTVDYNLSQSYRISGCTVSLDYQVASGYVIVAFNAFLLASLWWTLKPVANWVRCQRSNGCRIVANIKSNTLKIIRASLTSHPLCQD